MCSEHVSVDMNAQRMHLIRVAEHLGVKTPGVQQKASKQRRAATEGSRLTPHGLHPNLHNQEIDHLINGLQQGNLMICSLDQGKRPLRHDGDVDDLDMHNNGHVNNITKNGTCGISTFSTQTALNVPVSEHNGHVKLVQELHLWDLHGLHTDSTERTCLRTQRARQTCPRTALVESQRAGPGTVCTVRNCLCCQTETVN